VKIKRNINAREIKETSLSKYVAIMKSELEESIYVFFCHFDEMSFKIEHCVISCFTFNYNERFVCFNTLIANANKRGGNNKIIKIRY